MYLTKHKSMVYLTYRICIIEHEPTTQQGNRQKQVKNNYYEMSKKFRQYIEVYELRNGLNCRVNMIIEHKTSEARDIALFTVAVQPGHG